MAADMQKMSLSIMPPRRSARLQSQSEHVDPSPSVAKRTSTTARLRADQFCVYNIPASGSMKDDLRVAAFIVEYKAPHKLTLGRIYEGLGDMHLDEVVPPAAPTTPSTNFVIWSRPSSPRPSLTWSRLSWNMETYAPAKPSSSFEFPRECKDGVLLPLGSSSDVGATTGWTPNLDARNRLHMTAVGQVLAFTLQALKSTPRDQRWRDDAATQLKIWQVVYEDPVPNVAADDEPSSEYRPPGSRQHDSLRIPPIQLRPKVAPYGFHSCRPLEDLPESIDDESNPDTPSQRPQNSPYPADPALWILQSATLRHLHGISTIELKEDNTASNIVLVVWW
ncbi:MAG: hypothetical protein M1816_004698 [Peltula sp. TS41687]|nr:MAG: hypothetical protein M1816_004698 [Peltula sp. TS41687]